MHGQKICARENFIERHNFDFQITSLFGSHKRIVGDDIHAQRPRPFGYSPTDSTEADDAQRFPLQLNSNETLSLPFAGLQAAVRLRHAARQRH